MSSESSPAASGISSQVAVCPRRPSGRKSSGCGSGPSVFWFWQLTEIRHRSPARQRQSARCSERMILYLCGCCKGITLSQGCTRWLPWLWQWAWRNSTHAFWWSARIYGRSSLSSVRRGSRHMTSNILSMWGAYLENARSTFWGKPNEHISECHDTCMGPQAYRGLALRLPPTSCQCPFSIIRPVSRSGTALHSRSGIGETPALSPSTLNRRTQPFAPFERTSSTSWLPRRTCRWHSSRALSRGRSQAAVEQLPLEGHSAPFPISVSKYPFLDDSLLTISVYSYIL